MSIAAPADPSFEKHVSSVGRPFSLADLFESPPSSQRILPLEGMRGVAALMVFFVHFYALLGLYARPDSFLRAATNFAGIIGNAGVDVFFVISGFLMYGIVLRKPTPILTYLRRRVRRLYPVFLFVFLAYVVLSYVMPMESRIPRSPKAAGEYLLLNLAMLPGMLPIIPLVRVAWSLSYEWFYYLLLPFSMWAFRLRRWSSGWRIAFVLGLCFAQYVLCNLHWSSHPRLIMFGAGACLWELATYFGISRYLGWRGEACTIGLVFFALAWMGIAGRYHLGVVLNQAGIPSVNSPLLFVSFFALALYSLFYNGVLSRFFSITWLRWVGNISYSYYLIHGLTLHFVARLMRYVIGTQPLPAPLFLLLGAVAMLTTIVVSALLFLAIEKPLSITSAKPSLARGPRPVAVPGPALGVGLQDMEPVRQSRAN
jgi:exopolysaccharide production protein ExoZ